MTPAQARTLAALNRSWEWIGPDERERLGVATAETRRLTPPRPARRIPSPVDEGTPASDDGRDEVRNRA
jgi:hypothetical protein